MGGGRPVSVFLTQQGDVWAVTETRNIKGVLDWEEAKSCGTAFGRWPGSPEFRGRSGPAQWFSLFGLSESSGVWGERLAICTLKSFHRWFRCPHWSRERLGVVLVELATKVVGGILDYSGRLCVVSQGSWLQCWDTQHEGWSQWKRRRRGPVSEE